MDTMNILIIFVLGARHHAIFVKEVWQADFVLNVELVIIWELELEFVILIVCLSILEIIMEMILL